MKGIFNNKIFIFCISFLASILGIAAGSILFPQESSIVSIFLTSFALIGIVNKLFDINRQEIWDHITSPLRANEKLSFSLLIVFLGIMFGYGTVALLLNPDTTMILLNRQLGVYRNIDPSFNISNIYFGAFSVLLKHNFSVLLIVLFCALLYRTGGILLVITWNASTWGVVFSFIAKNIIQYKSLKEGIATLLVTYASVFMHLVTESGAYILCAMSGFFISKACVKYYKDTDKLLRVIKAAVLIFSISVFLIILSALIESKFTPKIVSFFIN